MLASLYQTEQNANQAWMDKNLRNVKTEKSRTRSGDSAAFHEGRVYGDGIGLQNQMTSAKSPKELS